ncbi:putative nudix hydrolase 14, chloroplastic [Iris pallida]|uniref:Nudix hydrolase 14, chloroplastic n=1 Tax=Iris pallida TaxID=29817 RepID=A0AAX6G3G1_IRIPA|nr:putative nudix hydrolase 14, chloroplastic [Iris pallida]
MSAAHARLLLLLSSASAALHFRTARPLFQLHAPDPNIGAPRNRRLVCRMASTNSPPPARCISLPGADPVQVVAAPGLSDSDLSAAIDSSLFKQWLKNMQSETGVLSRAGMRLRQVQIQGVDMFGRRVGFLKFKADVFDKETGTKIPGIVFARGPAVAVLILLESGGKTYVVLTEQVRVPVGKLIMAGMLDDDKGDVVGTAVREVEEETGISLKAEDMINLTAFLDPATGCKVFPSPVAIVVPRPAQSIGGIETPTAFGLSHATATRRPARSRRPLAQGGCDEELSLFLYRGSVSEEIISALQGKEMGLRDHGELIKVHVVPYDKLWRMTADAKVLSLLYMKWPRKRDFYLKETPEGKPSHLKGRRHYTIQE